MSLPLPCLPEAWNWGGLSFKELAVRTYEAVDKHETIDRAAISEEQVRDLFADFRREAYQAALQLRIDAAEAAFPPSEGL